MAMSLPELPALHDCRPNHPSSTLRSKRLRLEKPAARTIVAMSDDQPIELTRIMDLVGYALQASVLGIDPNTVASALLELKRPTARELAAARRENQEVHGSGTPEILRDFVQPSPIPEDVARLRRMVDDILVTAQQQLGFTP